MVETAVISALVGVAAGFFGNKVIPQPIGKIIAIAGLVTLVGLTLAFLDYPQVADAIAENVVGAILMAAGAGYALVTSGQALLRSF